MTWLKNQPTKRERGEKLFSVRSITLVWFRAQLHVASVQREVEAQDVAEIRR